MDTNEIELRNCANRIFRIRAAFAGGFIDKGHDMAEAFFWIHGADYFNTQFDDISLR